MKKNDNLKEFGSLVGLLQRNAGADVVIELNFNGVFSIRIFFKVTPVA